jgi:adenylate cyclase
MVAPCRSRRHTFSMHDPVDRLVRAAARRNPLALIIVQLGLANLIAVGGLWLFELYQPMSEAHFLVLLAVSQGLVTLANCLSANVMIRIWRPVREWERDDRSEAATIAAWRALATLPAEFMRRMRVYGTFVLMLPFAAFVVAELRLSWYSFAIVLAFVGFVFAYAVMVRYFAMEVIVRPVLERVATDLPSDFIVDAPGLPLRWRLIAAAPMISIVTGVVVAGIASPGHHARLSELSASLLIALGVTFTLSFDLVMLVSRSLLSTVGDLKRATERVSAGDLSVRVPVVATDETGALAQSFNHMVAGLGERERLRLAFGAYVDPGLAERVLKGGIELEPEELEATVLFLDIRDFTAFSERASPSEVVKLLNDLWELVVPVLLRHGGHANKFIGDGLLGVFGTPDHVADHPDRAVAAAIEIAWLVRTNYRGRVGVGIGVNTGSVVAGTVGGGGRVDFTVIGDAVNTASRVEAATRKTGDDVLITEATRAALRRDFGGFLERPPVPLKGKREDVRLWAPRELAGDDTHTVSAAMVID